MFGLPTTVSRIIVAVLFVALVAAALTVRSCQQARQKAAEARLSEGQAGAAMDSAKDAIATQGAAAGRERASDELTRANEKEIRDAKGAADPVNPELRDAGLRSLCRRAAYRHSERCRLLINPAQ